MVNKSILLSLVLFGCKSNVVVNVMLGVVRGKSCVVVEVVVEGVFKKVDKWVGFGRDIFDD